MRSTVSSATVSRSFTEQARRAQIVGAAIETIASVGLGRASYARIANTAGISSTSLISYHFENRKDLIAEVVASVYGNLGQYVGGRVGSAITPTERIREYIGANIDYAKDHPHPMRAVLSVFLSGGMGAPPVDAVNPLTFLERMLFEGQSSGEFRSFDVHVMAVAIQRSIEGAMLALSDLSAPVPDLELFSEQLKTTFSIAIRR